MAAIAVIPPDISRRAPVQATRLRFDDVDEAMSVLNSRFGSHQRVPMSAGPLGLDLRVVQTQRTVVGRTSTAVASVVRAVVRWPTVHVPLYIGLSYQLGRREIVVKPGQVAVLIQDHAYTVHNEAVPALAFQVDPELLREELESYSGSARIASPRCISTTPPPVAMNALGTLFEKFTAVAENAGDEFEGEDVAWLERSLAAWTAIRLLEQSGFTSYSPTAPELVASLEAWMRRHLAEPVTLDMMCAVSGVSARALQYACIAMRGRTPVELLADRRLEHARALLAARPCVTSVTATAVNSGFSHLGRFAVLYKRTYGESPSDTLMRR